MEASRRWWAFVGAGIFVLWAPFLVAFFPQGKENAGTAQGSSLGFLGRTGCRTTDDDLDSCRYLSEAFVASARNQRA